MGLGQMVQFGYYLDVSPAGEVRFDPLLEGGQARFFQAGCLGPRHRSIRHVGQGRPSPQRQRLAKPLGSRLVVSSGCVLASLGQEVLKAGSVESSTLDLQEVAGRLGKHDGIATCFSEGLAQAGDENSERPGGSLVDLPAPEVLHQVLGRDDAVGGQQEKDEDGPLAAPGKCYRPPLMGDLERTKDAEFHDCNPAHPSARGRPFSSFPSAETSPAVSDWPVTHR